MSSLRSFKGIAVVLACLITSGCFLQTLLGVRSLADGSLVFTVDTSVSLATCVQESSNQNNIECTYFFVDDNGVPVSATSSADLISELGILGVIIDPLILQVPQDLTIGSATFDAGAGAEALNVSVTGSFPVDAVTTAYAEPGQKFAIFEFPDTLAPMIPAGDAASGLPVDLSIELVRTRQPGFLAEPFSIKGVFTIPFDVGSTRYFVPMLPCTSDFSQIPAFEVDPDGGSADLLGPISALFLSSMTCTNRLVDFVSIGPQLLVSTDTLDFGPTPIGDTASRVLTLSNIGPGTLSISSLQGPAGAELAVLRDDCTGNQFNQGESCEVELTYQPAAAGSLNDLLTITSNDFNQATRTVAISATGTTQAPIAGASCTSANFGVTSAGSGQSFRRTLWNEGGANLTINSVGLADATHFSISLDECTGAVLAPTFGCAVEVTYQPQTEGPHSTTLSVSSSDPTALLDAVISGTNVPDVLFQNSFERVCN